MTCGGLLASGAFIPIGKSLAALLLDAALSRFSVDSYFHGLLRNGLLKT